jgi:tetratricopeptide (TPR) repeat protein
MWYLIVPPIVIVVSLLFVLWYLSRRGSDPSIARKISQLEDTAEQKISFSRTKNFFLRILEKTAYRFKVMSLQTHNVLNDVTQSLKEKRKDFQKETKNTFSESTEERVVTNESISLNEETIKRQSPRLNEKRVNIFQKDQIEKTVEVRQSEPLEVVARPMVSEKMVHPEVSYKKTPADIAYEESLIARIAVNPKDFGSYEKLGDYYLETGNIKDAKECYRQVLKLSPAERMVKIKIRRLEKILSQKG